MKTSTLGNLGIAVSQLRYLFEQLNSDLQTLAFEVTSKDPSCKPGIRGGYYYNAGTGELSIMLYYDNKAMPLMTEMIPPKAPYGHVHNALASMLKRTMAMLQEPEMLGRLSALFQAEYKGKPVSKRNIEEFKRLMEDAILPAIRRSVWDKREWSEEALYRKVTKDIYSTKIYENGQYRAACHPFTAFTAFRAVISSLVNQGIVSRKNGKLLFVVGRRDAEILW